MLAGLMLSEGRSIRLLARSKRVTRRTDPIDMSSNAGLCMQFPDILHVNHALFKAVADSIHELMEPEPSQPLWYLHKGQIKALSKSFLTAWQRQN